MENYTLYQDIKNTTNVIRGEELREIIYSITRVGAEMVVDTLGPFGKTILVDDAGFVYATKDGWATIRNMRFNDPVYNQLYTTIRKTSFNVASRVGDGTTTMFVAGYYFLSEVMDYLEGGESTNGSQIEFISMVKSVKEEVVNDLNTNDEILQIDRDGDFEDIRRIASISSNGNEALSLIIQDIYQNTGNPTINFKLDPGTYLDYDVIKGYVFECKPFRFDSYVNMADGTYKKTTPVRAIFFDHNLSYQEHGQMITSISKLCNDRGEEVILFAPYFDDILSTIFNTTIDNFVQQNKIPNIMLVQVPMSSEYHSKYYYDLSTLCNAQIFSYGKVRAFNALVFNATHEEKIEDALLDVEGMKYESTQEIIMSCLGTMNTVTFNRTEMLLENYESVLSQRAYDTIIKEAKETYFEEKTKSIKCNNMLRREFMEAQNRYTKLLGHMGVIKVGADSDEEKKCLFDSVEDAVLACKSAYESGYVRGLNLATINTIRRLIRKDELLREADEESVTPLHTDILKIFDRVFTQVTTAVLQNRYADDETRPVFFKRAKDEEDVLATRLSNDAIINTALLRGSSYNLVTNTFCNREAGYDVINPVNTDIQIMDCMVSILTLMITSGQYVSNNRLYDKRGVEKRTIEETRKAKRIEAEAKTEGVLTELGRHTGVIKQLITMTKGEHECNCKNED